MSLAILRILRPGPFTTVQDLGRPGLGTLGVPPAGAMDALALRAANLLVGNDEGAAGLEITLAGPEIEFGEARVVALTGSRFQACIGEREVPHGESFRLTAGERLRVGRSREGARGYLAVRGGITVGPVLGSRSTYVAGGWGGLQGRPLRAGDVIETGPASRPIPLRRLRPGAFPPYKPQELLRVIPGPQAEAFTGAGLRAFFLAVFRVSPRSDRIGLRLEGEAVAHAGPADLLPEGLVAGAIQVPADGQPIILGADRPATGGYTRIATVISADLGRVGQAKPGDRLRFVAVEVEEAQRIWHDAEVRLRSGIEEVA